MSAANSRVQSEGLSYPAPPSLVVVGRGTLGSGRDKVYTAALVIAHRFGNDRAAVAAAVEQAAVV